MSGLVTVRKSAERSLFALPERPQYRSECKDGPRPCPWLGCRHHLASDEHTDGTVRVDDDRSPERPSCSLDVAETRIMDVEEIAAVTGLWHTNVEDAMRTGMAKLAADPDLADAWRDLVQSNRAHPLAEALLLADEDEYPGGRPPDKFR